MNKSLYLLHIPKTGGRFIKQSILKHIAGIDYLNNGERHSGWSKKIKDDTYIICILRDPVEAACSLYAHLILSNTDESFNIDDDQDHVSHEIAKKINLNKNFFLKWIENNKSYHNFQSKNFFIEDTPSEMYEIDIDIDLLYSRINKVSLLIKTEDLKKNGPEAIVKKISKDLNVDINPIYFNDDRYSNPASKKLYDELSEEDKKFILHFFIIDQEIYNSTNLNFFNFIVD